MSEAETGQEAGKAEAEPEPGSKRGGRKPLARNVIRERIVHDLAEADKHRIA